MKNVLLIIAIGIFFNVSAQFVPGENIASRDLEMAWLNNYRKGIKPQKFPTGVIGSPYASEVFVSGDIYFKGKFSGSFPLRYDGYSDEMQVLDEVDSVKAILKTKDIEIVLNQNRYILFDFVEDDVFNQFYFIELIKGDRYDFLMRKIKWFQAGKPAQNSFVKAFPSKFSDIEEYFFKTDADSQPVRIPSSKRKFLNLLPDTLQEATEVYIKENNLSLKSKEDIVKIVTFLNEN
ncbi:MAG: hypothetical protein RQ735_00610 [Flavobacteriaceae bacterium]|nr:hypothetical protein [Flavobacteriaceae bacterium]